MNSFCKPSLSKLIFILFITSCQRSPLSNTQLDSLKTENSLLRQQIRSLGHTPVELPNKEEISNVKICQLVDFIDNTSQFKGKKIAIVADYDDGLKNKSLKDEVGFGAQFFTMDRQENKTNFYVHIDKGVEVPNAHGQDELIVGFLCTKGRLDYGNNCISIKRNIENLPLGTMYCTE